MDMKIVFFLGLFLTLTAFSFGQGDKKAKEQKDAQKQEQHIKLVMNQNGKVTKIDTTFNLADEKLVQAKIDSIMKKYGKDGKGNDRVFIMRKGNQISSANGWKVSPDGKGEQFEFTYNTNDSGKVKHERKSFRIIKDGHVTTMENLDGDMLVPPPPPVTPFHVRTIRMHGGDPFAFDPQDKDIISYDKKDIGKGLEKITIVRKKKSESDAQKEVKVDVEVKDDQKK